ncbi:MAG: hypothetical protein EAZ10_17855 [Oscillatoriales cyanobacterium]|nr:MAG: hypothetical protein EAZ10_17855 [Oscillatoriales cyanobacterium]
MGWAGEPVQKGRALPPIPQQSSGSISGKANISVGAKHDRRKYGIITNNLYAVMLRPLQK